MSSSGVDPGDAAADDDGVELGDHRRQARRWAVASVVLGCIWLVGVASVAAVAAGLAARVELARYADPPSQRMRKVADVGLALGLVGFFAGALVALEVI